LADYPDGAFDYAILSLTIQATRQPKMVLEQLLRIGRSAIVSFPNFGHWQVRARLAFTGRMPVTENLPEAWYVSPNAHLCTIKDLRASTMITPAKPGQRRAPIRSKAVAQRTSHCRSSGGMKSALVHSSGVNSASVSSRSSWPRL